MRRPTITDDVAAVARHSVSTHDPDLAHEMITQTYARHRHQLSGSTERFRFLLRTADVGPLASDIVQHSMSLHSAVQPMSHLTVGSVAGGSVVIRCGRQEESCGPGDVLLYPYGTEWDLEWTSFDQGLMRRVRLEHAHRDLQRADPAGSYDVTRIARRWGFGKLSQFEAFYQRAYGVAPTQTLLAT